MMRRRRLLEKKAWKVFRCVEKRKRGKMNVKFIRGTWNERKLIR